MDVRAPASPHSGTSTELLNITRTLGLPFLLTDGFQPNLRIFLMQYQQGIEHSPGGVQHGRGRPTADPHGDCPPCPFKLFLRLAPPVSEPQLSPCLGALGVHRGPQTCPHSSSCNNECCMRACLGLSIAHALFHFIFTVILGKGDVRPILL